MSEVETIKMIARYDADTKRAHRYLLETANGVAGSIYISKDRRPFPKQIVLELKTKGDA